MATSSTSKMEAVAAPQASWVPLIVVVAAQVLVIFNVAAVKVSIDGIATSLAAPANAVKTALVTHLLVIAAFIMLGNRLRQRFGARRVFRVMAASYAVAMAIMVVSPGAAALLAAQVAAGAAAAALIPALAKLIAENYRDAQRTRALGWLAAVRAITIVPAFLVAGALATWTSWRVTFGVLAACAAAVCWLSAGLTAADSDPGTHAGPIDKPGVALLTLAILLIGAGFNSLADLGLFWANAAAPPGPFNLSAALIVIVVGALFIYGFWIWSRRCSAGGRTPLIPLDLIGSPRQRAALIAMLTIGAIGSGITFLIPLYIEIVQGRTSLYTAAALFPYTLAAFAGALLILRMRAPVSSPTVTRGGFFAVAAGVALLALTIRNDWSDSMVILGMVVAGLGEGGLAALLFNVLVTAAPVDLADDADCLCGGTGYLGAGVGMALAGALVVTALSASVHRDVVVNPLIPEELRLELDLEKPSFVSNDRLQQRLARTTATPEQIAEAVRINTQARLRALKISLLVLAGLALLAGLRTVGISEPAAARERAERW
ncbi:MAG TPA: MFS transporter [Pseudomonadales bacterium]